MKARNYTAEELLDPSDNAPARDVENVLLALRALYPHFKWREPPEDYPPFEEYLSMLSAAQELPIFKVGALSASWRASLRLLGECLTRKTDSLIDPTLLEAFVAQLSPGDAIITFNWDTLIEQALMRRGASQTFRKLSPTKIAVLKLHGSLSWLRISRWALPDDWMKHISRIERNVYHGNTHKTFGLPDLEPLIIPPILSKRVADRSPLRSIWHSAFEALLNAEKVVFVGYSIPKDDLHARTLLAAGWRHRGTLREREGLPRDKYILIDPNPEVFGKYSSVMSADAAYYQERFSDRVLPKISGS